MNMRDPDITNQSANVSAFNEQAPHSFGNVSVGSSVLISPSHESLIISIDIPTVSLSL